MYLGILLLGFFGGYIVNAVFGLVCKKEEYIHFLVLCQLLEQEAIVIKDRENNKLNKEDIYLMKKYQNGILDNIVFKNINNRRG